MLRAISPGNDVYSFNNNYPKRNQAASKINIKKTVLPNIKQTKDQTTDTEEIKSSFDNNNLNINPNFFLPQNIIKNKFIFNGINNRQKIEYKDSLNKTINLINNKISNFNNKYSIVNLTRNNRNNKLFFNRNFKLKSIEKSMIKSNSSINIINKQQTLTIINIPSNKFEKNSLNNLINQSQFLKRSSSLPKINIANKVDIKNNDNENNKCNLLYLKYGGADNSTINNLKKKRFIPINSHKVIESLQSLSLPDDNYGQKLIDILENRINSGYYRKIKFNLSKNYDNSKIYNDLNNDIYNKTKIKSIDNKNIEKKEFSKTFLTGIYDKFLLPDKNDKYNYTIHKIFLNSILDKICKKMIEIRDVKNRLITKQEIREEYCNQLNKLREEIYKNKNFNIINNNIFNINNNTNIINIDFSNNNSLINEISTAEELQENSCNINTTNDEKDKDKQYLTSKLLSLVNNSQLLAENNNGNNFINIEKYSNQNLEKIKTKYKNISKRENEKLLALIKENLKLKNKDLSLHDTCCNIYLNKLNNDSNIKNPQIKKIKNIVKKNLYENNYISSLTETYYSEEKKLNNVDKFLLNTKKIRYTFNSNEKEPRVERNYSYDSEGNIQHSFNLSPKLNIVNFDDVFEDIQQQYDINNNTDKNYAKIQTIKEIMRYFVNNKNNILRLRFSNALVQKYLSMMIPYKSLKNINKKNKKKKKQAKIKKKNILEDISKKIHKKIKIKGGKVMNTEAKETKIKKHYNTEDVFSQRKKIYNLSDCSSLRQTKFNERLYTDNIYLEIETNSSEYTDVPSDLDSEIEEMIRRKKEREKDKEGEEGVYAPKKEDKSKGGDFIISNPKDRDKEKEKDKDKNLKQSINNNNDNKEQISSNENNSIKDDNLSSSLPDKDLQNVSNVYLNSNIDKYLNNNENNEIEKNKSFKGNKQLFRTNTLHLSKTNNISTNTTSGKSGIVDMKLNVDNSKKKLPIYRKNTLTILKNITSDKNILDDKKKNNKNTDIKNLADLHLAKKAAILENIIEEESKETKRPRISKETGKKIRKKRTTMRKDIKINTDTNRKNSSSATSDYEAYSLNNDINSDNKSNNYITSKYHQNDVNDNNNNYTNIINSEDKDNIKKEEEQEKSSSEEDLLDKKNNSFCGNRPKISTGDDDEEEEEMEDNITSKTISYFDSIKRKIDKIMSLKKDKNEINEENKENENNEEEENEEEEESEKRERIKRQKKNINIKGVKGLFMDENNGEIKNIGDIDDMEIEKVEEIPKKLGWEEKFELFKEYVKDLKNMNEEQFNYDAMKYLKENDKEDFSGKAKLSQVKRINRYKAFLIQAKAKRINYNNYYTSHVIFAPGCIFNTGELCK